MSFELLILQQIVPRNAQDSDSDFDADLSEFIHDPEELSSEDEDDVCFPLS